VSKKVPILIGSEVLSATAAVPGAPLTAAAGVMEMLPRLSDEPDSAPEAVPCSAAAGGVM